MGKVALSKPAVQWWLRAEINASTFSPALLGGLARLTDEAPRRIAAVAVLLVVIGTPAAVPPSHAPSPLLYTATPHALVEASRWCLGTSEQKRPSKTSQTRG